MTEIKKTHIPDEEVQIVNGEVYVKEQFKGFTHTEKKIMSNPEFFTEIAKIQRKESEASASERAYMLGLFNKFYKIKKMI